MDRTNLGSQGLEVSAQGLGCMGMTHAYGQGDERSGLETIHRALELGVTLLDTAEIYGPHTNEQLVDRAIGGRVRELAEQLGVTPAQVALAWVMAKGADIVPIPGTKRRGYLEENVAATEVELSDQEIAALDQSVSPEAVSGGRYSDRDMALLDH